MDDAGPKGARHSNDQFIDITKVDAKGNPMPGSGYQMKFIGGDPGQCLNKLLGPKCRKYLDNGVDIAMFQVAPMDSHGNFNLGPQVADMWSVIKHAKKIIVEVNENMPIAHGYQTQLNLYGIDYIVEGSNTPLAEIKPKKYSATEEKIADSVLERIQSHSTLQLGIGGMPNVLGARLAQSDLKDKATKEAENKGILDIAQENAKTYVQNMIEGIIDGSPAFEGYTVVFWKIRYRGT